MHALLIRRHCCEIQAHTHVDQETHTHTHTCEGTISELTIEVIKLMMIIAPKNSCMHTHS